MWRDYKAGDCDTIFNGFDAANSHRAECVSRQYWWCSRQQAASHFFFPLQVSHSLTRKKNTLKKKRRIDTGPSAPRGRFRSLDVKMVCTVPGSERMLHLPNDLINKSMKFTGRKIIYRCDGVEHFSSDCENFSQIPEERQLREVPLVRIWQSPERGLGLKMRNLKAQSESVTNLISTSKSRLNTAIHFG